ncbi:hypothetical protein KL86PLE_40736 [uncultured Pleomorphomonas sp.]|uniref:Uncharacterized protein n=1 Tax=uncultured Pleomorphomonas sp. TaxID=442121 RepID=A0A212LH89_9HYPH|nr:hypothetical protein KL86PLE_40736 [uncultured Pleomorphomonas sp.]
MSMTISVFCYFSILKLLFFRSYATIDVACELRTGTGKAAKNAGDAVSYNCF